ncbi:conserved hypothetical protein [Paraburkholderia piptadeniae]|uniref:Uncharacterized protein n=1 Tax=Paraburkholderia piptadeniae TaxID=1701573 RepID=A0A1N7SA64_9BURK|nr:conserved hypothetical protein [Paraburkholderia piptadeniae]
MHALPRKGPLARIATQRILDVFARSVTPRAALYRATPDLLILLLANTRNRPQGKEQGALFGRAKQATRDAAMRPVSGVRMHVSYVNRP